MTEILLFVAAGLLVALGGLMASLEAALDVTSRTDLADLADEILTTSDAVEGPDLADADRTLGTLGTLLIHNCTNHESHSRIVNREREL